MEITKKENKDLFDALVFCDRARSKTKYGFSLEHIQVKQGRAITTDGHRLHIAWAKDLTDGLYEYEKKKQTITLTPTNDGNFPDLFKELERHSVFRETSVDTKELLHMSKMAKIMVSDAYQGTVFTFNGCCNLKTVNPDIGDMTGDVAINKSVKPEIKKGLCIKYVIDALRDLDKTVKISLCKEEQEPIMFRDKTKCAVVMPMRI